MQRSDRSWVRRKARRLVVAAVIVAVYAVVLSQQDFSNHSAASKPTTVYPSNGFGGYGWDGSLMEIAAQWRVPAIAANSVGDASTWVGADDQSYDHFIQLGVTEDSYSPGAPIYEAFWSSGAVGYSPKSLGAVRSGDRVAVEMTKNPNGWLLTFVDRTSGLRVQREIHYGAAIRYRHGSWTQEDPSSGDIAATDLPYPQMAAPTFDHLEVNGAAPLLRLKLASVLLTSGGTILVPTTPVHNSFTLSAPTGLKRQYLIDEMWLDAHDAVFDAQYATWDHTGVKRRVDDVRRLARSYNNFANALSHQRWPSAVTRVVDQLVKSKRRESMILKKWAQSGADGSSNLLQRANDQRDRSFGFENTIRASLALPPTS